jgi:hypothetical protein
LRVVFIVIDLEQMAPDFTPSAATAISLKVIKFLTFQEICAKSFQYWHGWLFEA